MKVWISQNTKNTNRYTARLVLTLIGIIILLPLAMFGTIILAHKLNRSMEIISMAACIGFTVIIIYTSLKLGKLSNRDAQIFCQDDEHNLFVVNARDYVGYHRGILGFFSMASETQRVLENLKNNQTLERQMMQEKSLTGLATQIISVESLKPDNKGYIAVCRVRYRNGNTGKYTYLLEDGYDNQSELIAAFERKRQAYSPEVKVNYNPVKIIISLLALAACVTVCVMSHPAIGFLPEKIYFPVLWVTYAMLFPVIYFIVKQKRGE